METHKVIKVNVDNVIPFRKPKSGLTSKQENLINETLLVLNEKLTRINKCSVRELKDCFYEDDENRWDTDVFEDFYIGDEKDKDQMKCWFGYKIENRKLYIRTIPTNRGRKVSYYNYEGDYKHHSCMFPKKSLTHAYGRKRISIWIASRIFEHFGTDEELQKSLGRNVFGISHYG